MKTFILFLSIFIFLGGSPRSFASAENTKTYYAKVTSSGTFLYSACNEHSLLFEIPSTYFVLLTSDANEEFYTAKYGDCMGYVKKSQVTPMNGSPKQPYASNYNFRITSMSGLPLMSSPTFESETLLNIDFLEDNIFFYGNIQGQEYFSNSTDIWHYCSYSKNNQIYYGYLFSYYCNFQTSIPNNNEYFEEITETLVFTIPNQASNTTSDTIKAIIVLAIIIPVLIACYFFITPKRKKQNSSKSPRRKQDYYELSENDLN